MTSVLEKECERTPKVTGSFEFGKAKQYRSDRAHNWRVTLHHQGRQLTVDFYGGEAVSDPSVADVLSSLMLDTEAGEQSFEDFCADFGYDTDSRKAYATWEQCRTEGPDLHQFLGSSWDRFYGLEH